jgi:hypothetical protein
MPMKKFADTIGNQTRDLPVFSTVPQPTAPPQPPIDLKLSINIGKLFFKVSFGSTRYEHGTEEDYVWEK